MLLLSIWTGAWVGRAGLLAESFSFFLIAPEILGEERLKGVDQALKGWLSGREIPLRVGYLLAGLVFAAPLAVMLVGLTYWHFQLPVSAFIICFAFAGALLGAYLYLMVTGGPLPREMDVFSVGPYHIPSVPRPGLLERVGGLLLTILWSPLFVAALGTLALGKYANLPLEFAIWLMRGPKALRGLVFGTGVVLLVGGLLAQFVATF